MIAADGSYGNHRFLGALKDQPCTVIVRRRADRVLYGAAEGYAGAGRPRVHGRPFAFKDPATWGPPAEEVRFEDERYGQVRLRVWHSLHAKQDVSTPFSVIRAEVHLEREAAETALVELPECSELVPPHPLVGFRPALAHRTRHPLSQAALYWTLPQFRQPDRCDRWT